MKPSLTKRKRYDYRDIDRSELKLIRVGHYLWFLYKRALKAGLVPESEPILAALETVWQLKRELREELAMKRKAEGAAYFASRRESR